MLLPLVLLYRKEIFKTRNSEMVGT
jgi:hypothetical protein